jgi:hypothetical protein
LWLGGNTIMASVAIRLAAGNNTLWLQKGNTNVNPNILPDPFAGFISIDAGPGINTLYYDSADVPPANTIRVAEVNQTVAIPSWALIT